MVITKRLIIVLAVMLCMASASAHAADELMDDTAAKCLEQGLSFLKAKDYNAAIGKFEESAEIYPDAEVYYYLGYAYYLKGRGGNEESRSRSLENFEKAYEIDPNFTPTRFKPGEPAPPVPTEKSLQGGSVTR